MASLKVEDNSISKTNATNELSNTLAKIETDKERQENINRELSTAKEQKNENTMQLKQLLAQDDELRGKVEDIQGRIDRTAAKLQTLLPPGLFHTLQQIEDEQIPGYYGLVADFIDISAKFLTAADIVSKNKVFSVIVDTFETAKVVLDFIKRINGASITIYPVQWIKDLQYKTYDFKSSNNAIHLLRQITPKKNITFDITPILNSLFSKALLVRNYDVTNSLAKEKKMHCITPDG